MDKKVWIILGVVLGTLVLMLAITLVLFTWKRSKRRIRGFSLRAVTPLDDSEFESWRRPSQYTKRSEKAIIRPTQPAMVRSRTPTMFEKELNLYETPRTPSPHQSTMSPLTSVQKPERVRRKSSVCSSIADRPPTPYSPPSFSGEFLRQGSPTSPRSERYMHSPSMSEVSAFNFNFADGSPPLHPPRLSHQSDRPLSYSYARYGESV